MADSNMSGPSSYISFFPLNAFSRFNRMHRMGRMDNAELRDWDNPLAPFGKGEFTAEESRE
jgi:hypothetical protein